MLKGDLLEKTFRLIDSALKFCCRLKYSRTTALTWVKNKVKALGVWFPTDPKVTMEANYPDKWAKVCHCLGSWEYWRLSLLGKITVLKSLWASKLVYILSTLQTNCRVLKELSKSFFDLYGAARGKIQAKCAVLWLFRRNSWPRKSW